jgi:hypothetical protein
MIAYNRQFLDNRSIRLKAEQAADQKIITTEEYTRIREAYPSGLYTPNIFIRIGLFLLTVLASLCCLGLFALVTGTSGSSSFGSLFIIVGLMAYAALEIFIRTRKWYCAGVDDALLWVAGGMILTGINIIADQISPYNQSLIVLLLAGGGTLRYGDRLMTLVAYGALLSLLFHAAIDLGAFARSILPFGVMLVSVAFYLLSTRLSNEERLRHYHSCLLLLRVAALLSFYLAGNYFVVRQMNALISSASGPIALGWLWWLLTAVTPVFYSIKGIQKKDPVFLWTGLILIAASVFTVRYYYHILSPELAMIIGGVILVTGAYGLIRYLHPSKYGFTSASPEEPHILGSLPVEGLILAESFRATGAQPAGPDIRFGGGSGGGGGAGGEY